MRKTIINTCLILSALLILLGTGSMDSILMFIMTGLVPGTNVILAPIVMLFGFSAAGFAVIFVLIYTSVSHYVSINRRAHRYMKSRKSGRKQSVRSHLTV